MGNRRYHYAWTVVAVAFCALLVSAALRAIPTILIVPLEQEFGWSRATISFAVGVLLLVYGLIGPFAAGLIDRFGLRRTMVWALAFGVASFGATPLVRAPWQLTVVWGVGTGLGAGSTALVLAAIIANRWFVKNRGLAMGIMTASAAIGQFISLPFLAIVIAEFGWRASVFVACAAGAMVLPLAHALMQDRPADIGLKPYGVPSDTPDEPVPPRANPVTAAFSVLGEVIGSRDFWLLSASFFVCGATTFGLVGTHFIPACLDHRIPAETGANILAAMGVFSLVGTLASGWCTDRFDSRWLLFWYYAMRGLSLLFLPYAFDLSFWSLPLFGLFNGLDFITTVPPTARITSSVFGLQKAGIVYGWVMVMHQVGAAIFAYAAGVLRTALGDYFVADIGSGVICFAAALLVLGIGRPRRTAMRPALAGA